MPSYSAASVGGIILRSIGVLAILTALYFIFRKPVTQFLGIAPLESPTPLARLPSPSPQPTVPPTIVPTPLSASPSPVATPSNLPHSGPNDLVGYPLFFLLAGGGSWGVTAWWVGCHHRRCLRHPFIL